MAATLVWLSAAVAGHAAPVLTASGATGVDVGGSLYDVSFVDGSCATLFTNCGGDPDAGSVDFAFTTEEGATLASSALLNLFNATGNEGFTANPAMINGCEFFDFCGSVTPFTANISTNLLQLVAFRNFDDSPDTPTDFVSSTFLAFPDDDTSGFPGANYAVWTPVPQVPVPASLPLLAAGLAGLAAFARRTRKMR
jgi:hypothetical protein